MNRILILGQVLEFRDDPFKAGLGAVRHHRRGAIIVEDGQTRDVGDADHLRRVSPDLPVHDHGDALILPGFIDAHAHYPQTAIIASWGKRLIDWLNTYTFPEEMRFLDPDYAREVANRYFDLILANGTTTVASFCTIHPESVDAFFAEAKTRGMLVMGGKTCMDRDTAPAGLRDTAQSAYDESKTLIQRWHDPDSRLLYALTPRFSPTSTDAQLAALGALSREYSSLHVQTHLSEQTDEIAWMRSLYPKARDYLDTYETHGLLHERSIFGHAIHLEPREIDRIAETGASVVHCPTSNTFIGSGLFDMSLRERIKVGLATDTGGGSSFSMLRTMAAAYEIAQLKGTALHPSELLWLATGGSARALGVETSVGQLGRGMDADYVVLDLASTPAIAQASARAEDIWEAVFPTIMMGDDRAISQVYVAGRPVHPMPG